ncbi:MAG: hypothetical protein KDD34_06925 [Bdellovibrionales bacterium]|nr:hypothetical protein [Bdellovibrionales bacterium]
MLKAFKPLLVTVGLLLSTMALAGITDVEKFNSIVKEILAPLNNNLTQVDMTANTLTFSGEKLSAFNGDALLAKEGKFNRFAALINLSFLNENETSAAASGSLALDLPTAFGQDTLNKYAPYLADYAKELVAQYTSQYGDNAEVTARVYDSKYDDNENILELKFEINISITLENLDKELLESTFLKNALFTLTVHRAGMTFDGNVDLNPDYKYFKETNSDIKELFSKLLEKDTETMNRFYSNFESLDDLLEDIVNTNANEEN